MSRPVQEPTPWRDMVVVSLVREGINKHKARELADHFAAQPPLPVQEDSCFCHSGVSLQSVSGGAAPEGYLGKVTLLIDGEYVDYVKAQPPLPVQEPLEQLRPAEFIQLTKGKEAVTGIPAYCWSEWLNKEQP